MPKNRIDPSSVTKPIQLLAAWLVGLLTLNGSFLVTAVHIDHPPWASGFLIICAALNVPIFIASLFLLQTKFRPEMQEDQFYSQYLEKKFSFETKQNELIPVEKPEPVTVFAESSEVRHRSPGRIRAIDDRPEVQINDLLRDYDKISADLFALGYKQQKTFGSTSRDKEVPNEFVISISKDVPLSHIRKILSGLEKYKFDAISLSGEFRNSNKIHIGSYVYKYDSIPKLKYTDEVKKKIFAPNFRRSDLVHLVGDWSGEDEED